MIDWTKIIDFEVGQCYEGYYLVKSKEQKTDKNGRPYIDYAFVDNTASINGKHWSPLYEPDYGYESGDVVFLKVEITEFNAALQAKVLKIRHVTEDDRVELSEIVPCAPISPELMLKEILDYVDKIGDQDIKKLVMAILDDKRDRLIYYPAAMNYHHSIRSGLLYHTLRMLRGGMALCKVYPEANPDLVCAGIVLHDMEKIGEMNSNELGLVDAYTREGNLLGHIVMGVVGIDRKARELGTPEEKKLLLEHLVLSHHYEPEWGSPKRPMIIEGEIIHHMDMLDAHIYDMDLALKNTEPGGFSSFVPTLDRRRIYKTEGDR